VVPANREQTPVQLVFVVLEADDQHPATLMDRPAEQAAARHQFDRLRQPQRGLADPARRYAA
jgi:hypothetical protein